MTSPACSMPLTLVSLAAAASKIPCHVVLASEGRNSRGRPRLPGEHGAQAVQARLMAEGVFTMTDVAGGGHKNVKQHCSALPESQPV